MVDKLLATANQENPTAIPARQRLLEWLRRALDWNAEDDIEEDETIEPQIIGFGKEGRIAPFPKRSAGITSKGTRENNEDGILIGRNFIALADGFGGCEDGEKASGFALEGMSKELESKSEISSFDLIYKALAYLKTKVQQREIDQEFGTTLAIVQTRKTGKKVIIDAAHTGDSQILIIDTKKKKVIYQSTDQTIYFDDEDPLPNSPEKYEGRDEAIAGGIVGYSSEFFNNENGGQLDPEAEKVEIEADQESIIVAIVCDGISRIVSPEEICDVVCSKRKTPEQMVQEIEQIALKRHMTLDIRVKIKGVLYKIVRKHRVKDNTSCVIIRA